VIAVGEQGPVRQLVHRAVRKRVEGAAQSLGREDGVVGDGAEREDRRQLRQCGELGGQELAAGVDLGGFGLVLRRHAADRVGDAGAPQLEPVRGMGAVMAGRETRLRERAIEQIAGKVAGERAAGPVGASEAWRQPDDQQRRRRIAERRDGGVEPVGMRQPLRRPEGEEPRTQRAVASGGAARGELRGRIVGQGLRLSVTRSPPVRRAGAPSRRAGDGRA